MTKTVMVLTSGMTSDWTPVVSMFHERGWNVVTDLEFSADEHLDLICFCGGSDVSPYLYGEENISSYCDPKRDEYEKEVYETYVGKIPLVGICRGGQFLNVMNGGKMIQHIEGHSMSIHPTHMMKWCNVSPKEYIDTYGDHHQAMVIGENGTELATGGGNDWSNPTPDVVWYEKTKSLCFQPHPEWGHKETGDLFFDLLEEYL